MEAKLLGLVLLTLRGTPFIYQGEELAMTNQYYPRVDDYNDVEMKGQYQQALEYGIKPEEALRLVAEYSRDNARSPMQWDGSRNAGFTTGEPWMRVHDDYKTVNAAHEEESAASVLSWFRHLVYLRNHFAILLAGEYRDLMPGSDTLYVFERSLAGTRAVVLANFTNEEQTYDPALVADVEPHTSSLGLPESIVDGVLRSMEAVLYVSPCYLAPNSWRRTPDRGAPLGRL